MLAVHDNKVGLIQFRESLSTAARSDLLSHRPLSLLVDDEDWDITANRYRQLTADQAFQAIRTLHAKTLKIRWNEAPQILYELKAIAFPQLQELYLNGNSIASVELLFVVSLENLRVLNLRKQYQSAKIAPKMSYARTRRADFLQEDIYSDKNKVNDFMPLFQMHAPSLRIIWTTPQNDSFDSGDINWVFRLQSRRINKLYVKHERSQPFNLDTWKQMVKMAFPKAKHIYRIQDDIALRLE